VLPPQAEQLGLTEACRRRREDQEAQHRTAGVAANHLIRDRVDDGVELGQGQELKVGISVTASPALGARSLGDGIR
jgi:hypothetical protein